MSTPQHPRKRRKAPHVPVEAEAWYLAWSNWMKTWVELTAVSESCSGLGPRGVCTCGCVEQ
eukprot:3154926-Amphidinium_carterae.1